MKRKASDTEFAANGSPKVDEIAIAGIRAYGRHGAYPGERDDPQAFDVALKLDVDLAVASRSDSLADTIDYADVHRRVIEIVEQRSFALLERLGAEVLDAVFADQRVRGAEVTIGKPGLLDGATASVTLRRTRVGGETGRAS
jgi:7,8-dihydroneopterin aldolase/epimerase/oxygenase